ncbi:mCG144627, partial [Mus musculus]
LVIPNGGEEPEEERTTMHFLPEGDIPLMCLGLPMGLFLPSRNLGSPLPSSKVTCSRSVRTLFYPFCCMIGRRVEHFASDVHVYS